MSIRFDSLPRPLMPRTANSLFRFGDSPVIIGCSSKRTIHPSGRVRLPISKASFDVRMLGLSTRLDKPHFDQPGRCSPQSQQEA